MGIQYYVNILTFIKSDLRTPILILKRIEYIEWHKFIFIPNESYFRLTSDSTLLFKQSN